MARRRRLIHRLKRHREMAIINAPQGITSGMIQRHGMGQGDRQSLVKAFLPYQPVDKATLPLDPSLISDGMGQSYEMSPHSDSPPLISYEQDLGSTPLQPDLEQMKANDRRSVSQASEVIHPIGSSSGDVVQRMATQNDATTVQVDRSAPQPMPPVPSKEPEAGPQVKAAPPTSMSSRVWRTVQRLWNRDREQLEMPPAYQTQVETSVFKDQDHVARPLGPIDPPEKRTASGQIKEGRANHNPVQREVDPVSNEFDRHVESTRDHQNLPIQKRSEIEPRSETNEIFQSKPENKPETNTEIVQRSEVPLPSKPLPAQPGVGQVLGRPINDDQHNFHAHSHAHAPAPRLPASVPVSGQSSTPTTLSDLGQVMPTVSPPPVQRQPAAGPAQSGTSPNPEPSSQPEQPDTDAENGQDAVWERLKRISEMHSLKASVSASSSVLDRDAKSQNPQLKAIENKTAEEVGLDHGADGQRIQQRQLDGGRRVATDGSGSHTLDKGDEAVLSPARAGHSFSGHGPLTENRSPAERQPLALNEIWPVQRRMDEQVSDLEGVDQVPRRSDPMPDTSSQTVNQKVDQILKGIDAGRSSQTSVQFVPPRGSRPRRGASKNELGSSSQVSKQDNGPIQRAQSQEDLTPSVSRSSALADPSDSEREATVPVIDTAVGALPADFWSILGEPEPISVQENPPILRPGELENETAGGPESNAKAGPSSPLTPPFPLQRMPIEEDSDRPTLDGQDSLEPQSLPLEALLGLTSAVFSEDDVASQGEQSQQVSGRSSPEPMGNLMGNGLDEPQTNESNSGEGKDLNLDEVAREVYKSLKKKLDIEWERRRLR